MYLAKLVYTYKKLIRNSWKLKYWATSMSDWICVCVCEREREKEREREISSYFIAKVIYFQEEESKGRKIAPSFTKRNKKFYNPDAHLISLFLKNSRVWHLLLM